MSQRSLAAYKPLDEILDTPPVRILRALRWFDWATRGDLFLALDDLEPDSIRWAAHQQALVQLVKRGSIESCGRGRRTTQTYRITRSGHAELARRLERAA